MWNSSTINSQVFITAENKEALHFRLIVRLILHGFKNLRQIFSAWLSIEAAKQPLRERPLV